MWLASSSQNVYLQSLENPTYVNMILTFSCITANPLSQIPLCWGVYGSVYWNKMVSSVDFLIFTPTSSFPCIFHPDVFYFKNMFIFCNTGITLIYNSSLVFKNTEHLILVKLSITNTQYRFVWILGLFNLQVSIDFFLQFLFMDFLPILQCCFL